MQREIANMNLAAEIKRVAKLSGQFQLRSGTASSTYFDKYQFESHPQLLRSIAEGMAPLIPSVVSTGGAISDALEKLRVDGVQSLVTLCVIDRETGGSEALAKERAELRSLFRMSDSENAA